MSRVQGQLCAPTASQRVQWEEIMALPRWVKWSLGALGVFATVFAFLLGAGLWFLASQATPDVTIGEPLPAVVLATLDGEPIEIESYRGQVVVLDFWSSW
jgi:hypothetical protein